MTPLPFTTLDVFTSTPYAGNPLALVRLPANTNPSTSQLQLIAREFNLSETLFLHVQEKDDASNSVPTFRVRIFLTNAEIPFAGHPTIGCACYVLRRLAPSASVVRLICNAGPIEVTRTQTGARARVPMAFHRHLDGACGMREVVAAQRGLEGRVKGVEVVSPVKGMNFVCVELEGVEALAEVKVVVAEDGLVKLDEEWDVGMVGWYYYCLVGEGGQGKVGVRCRMVKNGFEDAATGSAASGLGALLAMKRGVEKSEFEIVQGVEMGRESRIGVEVTLEESNVKELYLEGEAVEVMEGTVRGD